MAESRPRWDRGDIAANTFGAEEVELLCQICRWLARSGHPLARSEAFAKLYRRALAMEASIKERRKAHDKPGGSSS
jgi:hypothetical protein